jgi:hypothetical protein
MAARHLRTSQIAKDLGGHVNTIRLYEADGLLPAIPHLVKSAANADLGMAMELAYKYLAHVRVERTFAESPVEFLERGPLGS